MADEADGEALEATLRLRDLNIEKLVQVGGCPSMAAAQRSEAAVWSDVTQHHGGFHVHAYVWSMHQLHGTWNHREPRTPHSHKSLQEVINMTDMSDTLNAEARAKHSVDNLGAGR